MSPAVAHRSHPSPATRSASSAYYNVHFSRRPRLMDRGRGFSIIAAGIVRAGQGGRAAFIVQNPLWPPCLALLTTGNRRLYDRGSGSVVRSQRGRHNRREKALVIGEGLSPIVPPVRVRSSAAMACRKPWRPDCVFSIPNAILTRTLHIFYDLIAHYKHARINGNGQEWPAGFLHPQPPPGWPFFSSNREVNYFHIFTYWRLGRYQTTRIRQVSL